jgi:hypothetical protein
MRLPWRCPFVKRNIFLHKHLDNQYWEWILETTPLKLQAKIIAAKLANKSTYD